MVTKSQTVDVTVVVPTYEVERTVKNTLTSVAELDGQISYEVVVVDDCSSDGTFRAVSEFADGRKGWLVTRFEVNSGSPSGPRNAGIEMANGEFLFFLDGDDLLYPANLVGAVRHAQQHRLDVVRSPLEVHHVGGKRFVTDRIDDFDSQGDKEAIIRSVVESQSLTSSCLIRRSILLEPSLRYDESVRMGEDLDFVTRVLVRAQAIGYYPEPVITYVRHESRSSSAMYDIGTREFLEFSVAWRRAQDELAKVGVSYLEARGPSAITYALGQLRRFGREEIGEDAFLAMHRFFSEHATTLRGVRFDPRTQAKVDAILSGDYDEFCRLLLPRLVIAGHDLKFIEGALPFLEKRYAVRVDEWASERTHIAARSRELAKWADIVFCEWLTTCAVWYTRNAEAPRKVVVRAHRYDVAREDGFDLDLGRTHAVIGIAPHMVETIISRFDFPREMVRYVPNYYLDGYESSSDPNRVYKLAMVGIVPRLKGWLRSLELLRRLRAVDARYTLTVMGKQPEEYGWVKSDPQESAYYEACTKFIEEHELGDAITFAGWVDTKRSLADYGFVLSMSDLEGSHVAPGEAFCAGNQAVILRWRGAEFVYPERFVVDSIEEAVEFVVRNSDPVEHALGAALGRRYIEQNYSVRQFVDRLDNILREALA